ncbi:CBBY-like protein [Drosera capensis]
MCHEKLKVKHEVFPFLFIQVTWIMKDKVLIDVHRTGNCRAFNVAFRKLGLDCANWTDPIYSDLFRKSSGDEERMLVLFFNRIGWPTSLPTSEKENFMKRVLSEKKAALGDLLKSQSLPLRPGVEKFIDDACSEKIPVVVLVSSSELGEETARATVEKLGHERMSKLKIVGHEEVEKSLFNQFSLDNASFSGLGEELAAEASKAVALEKLRVAEEVASILKLRVDLDAASAERILCVTDNSCVMFLPYSFAFDAGISMQKIITTLRAGAEYAGVPARSCALVAGTHTAVAAADRIGMPCIVLQSSLTSTATFPSAKAVMDGFGDADLTVSRLRRKLLA